MPIDMQHRVMALSDQLREWLEKIGSEYPYNRGTTQYISARTGLQQPNVSRVRLADRPGQLRFESLDRMADHLDVDAWVVVHLIQTGTPPPLSEKVMAAIKKLEKSEEFRA